MLGYIEYIIKWSDLFFFFYHFNVATRKFKIACVVHITL